MVLKLIKGLSHRKTEVHFSIHRKPARAVALFPYSLGAREEFNPIGAPQSKDPGIAKKLFTSVVILRVQLSSNIKCPEVTAQSDQVL